MSLTPLTSLDNDTCNFTVGQGGIATSLGAGNGGTGSISFVTNTGFNRSYPSGGSSAIAESGGCGGGSAPTSGFQALTQIRQAQHSIAKTSLELAVISTREDAGFIPAVLILQEF